MYITRASKRNQNFLILSYPILPYLILSSQIRRDQNKSTQNRTYSNENRSKIYQQYTKGYQTSIPNIHQKTLKSIKNHSKIDQHLIKNRAWRALGGPLGALGGQDRKRSRGIGFLGTILGPSWRPLGAVLALGSPSWAVLGRLGVVLGRLKIDVKIDQKINAFQDRFLMLFWWILGGKMAASWH